VRASVVVIALLSASAGAEPARVCFVGALDAAGESDATLTRSIEPSFSRVKSLTVLPSSSWPADGELARSIEPDALKAAGSTLNLWAAIVATVDAADALGTRVQLRAVDVATGETIATSTRQVSVDFGGGAPAIRLSRQQADALVADLVRSLRSHKPPPPPKVSANTPPTAPSPATASTASSSTPPASGTPSSPAASAPAPSAPSATAPPAGAEPTPAASTPSSSSPAASGTASTTPPREANAEPPAPLEEPSLESLASVKPDLKLGGNVGFTEWIYFSQPPDKTPGRHEVLGALQLTAAAPLYTAVARILARKDFGDPDRDRLEAEEAYVDAGYAGFRVRAGRTIIVWDPWINVAAPPGSPITPTDTRDLIRSEVLPVYNLRLSYDFGPATIEAYYLPVPERNLGTFTPEGSADGHAVSDSRWYIAGSFEKGVFKTAPSIPPIALGPLDPPAPSLENAQGAVRAFTALDWIRAYVAYGYVLSLNPVPVPAKTASADGLVDVAVTYPREHLVDAAAAVTLGLFSAGADLTMTAAPNLAKADAVSTLGLGLTSPLIAGAHRIAGGVVVITKSGLLPNTFTDVKTDLTTLSSSTAIAYASYAFGRLEVKTIMLQGGVTAPNLLDLVQVKLRFGAVTAMAAVSSAWGGPKTVFGQIGDIDRAELSLSAAL
jgi:hypothetical protein